MSGVQVLICLRDHSSKGNGMGRLSLRGTVLRHVLLAASICVALGGGHAQRPKASQAAYAQSGDDAPLPIGGVVDLTTQFWRGHCGDDPSWSAADFDDSGWTAITPGKPLPVDATPHLNSICWYWVRVHVAPGIANPGLYMNSAFLAYDLWVNGQRVGTSGGLPPQRSRRWLAFRLYTLPPALAANGMLTISVRTWMFDTTGTQFVSVPFNLKIGLVPELEGLSKDFMVNQVSSWLEIVLGATVGLFALGFYAMQRQRREYLWLAIYGFGFLGSVLYVDYSVFAGQPALLWAAVTYSFSALIPLAFVEFFLAFLSVRGWWLRVVRVFEVGMLVPIPLAVMAMAGLLSFRIAFEWQTFAFLPMALLLPVLIFIEYRRGNPEAIILLLPAALALGSYNVGTVLNVLTFMHFNVSAVSKMLLFHVGLLPVPIYSVFLSCFWLSIGLIILLRANRANREQARLANELEAARSVQKLLLADEAVETPGFAVESVYLPAAEVGGDFFLMQPGSDGSLLVVVGDVSGKGVPAALAVSTIVGALRGTDLRSPAAVLAHLNRVLHRHISGFATCCVLHLPALSTGMGTFTIANAGHIPPYRNGKALLIGGDLPLAILPEVAYEEEQISFAAGDRFTIISDGVLEATNPLREMFGFERTEAISVEPAATIAETARAFGHQDDITVVTLVVDAA